MKKIQSVLCAMVLALSLSSAVFAGNIHGTSPAPVSGTIHGVSASGILVSDVWSGITSAIVSIFGNIHG